LTDLPQHWILAQVFGARYIQMSPLLPRASALSWVAQSYRVIPSLAHQRAWTVQRQAPDCRAKRFEREAQYFSFAVVRTRARFGLRRGIISPLGVGYRPAVHRVRDRVKFAGPKGCRVGTATSGHLGIELQVPFLQGHGDNYFTGLSVGPIAPTR